MKILLFDDHRIFGESLSKLLEDWDAISICHYVSNETEFWNILSVDEWDIVLLDVNLRDQSKNSGIDLIEKIYNKSQKQKWLCYPLMICRFIDRRHLKEVL